MNEKPLAGVAASVNAEPLVYCALQILPQLIFPSLLVTVPEVDPVPPNVSDTAYCGGGGAPNVAVTLWFEPTVILHAPVPVQAPLQPVNADPVAGVAARLTVLPEAYVAEQVAPQLILASELVTVPE